ncbi:TerB family tellurite resistance protein [Streptomyces sp. NPDC052236]|uniref:TerB family tellurite resistance protein n=1 Tax=Streptomyces sp. NPDC052236 TaxID=3365686 RepID=UPI0037D4609D
MPHTPGSPSRLHLQDLRRFHGLHPDFGGSALPVPAPKGGPLTTPQTSRDATDRCFAPPLQGFRHWASTPGVSPRRRQSATGPPGSYPDRTSTGRRQRAYDSRSATSRRPPSLLGARKREVRRQGQSLGRLEADRGRAVIQTGIVIAGADGYMAPAEQQVMHEACAALGLSPTEFAL